MEIYVKTTDGSGFFVKTDETYPVSAPFNTADDLIGEAMRGGVDLQIAERTIMVEFITVRPNDDGAVFEGRIRTVPVRECFIKGTLAGFPLAGAAMITVR